MRYRTVDSQRKQSLFMKEFTLSGSEIHVQLSKRKKNGVK